MADHDSLETSGNSSSAGSERFDFSSGAHGDPSVWLPRLHRLLDDQLKLAAQVEAIDQQKRSALADDEMDEYLALLEERQPVVDAMAGLNEELAPFADRFALLATGLKEEQRESIYAQAGALDAALAAITQRDTEEAAELARRRDEVARELAGVQTGRNALGAYGTPGERLPPQSHDGHG